MNTLHKRLASVYSHSIRRITTSINPTDAKGNPIVSHELPEPSCGTCPSSQPVSKKKPFMQYTLKQLETEFQEMGIEKYRAKQVFKWVYQRGALSFDTMTDLKVNLRERLSEEFTLYTPELTHLAKSTDGTRKYLFAVPKKPGKGTTIETVYIPGVGEHEVEVHGNERIIRNSGRYVGHVKGVRGEEEDDILSNPDLYSKGSVCVSSQIGCSLQCAFCHTGTMPKSELRNLTSDEIVGQIMHAKHDLGDFTPIPYNPHTVHDIRSRATNFNPTTNGKSQQFLPISSLTNIVMMGMGEPGYNYNNVKKTINILMDKDGLGLGKRRITVSTSGVIPAIEKLGQDSCVNLAISLHAVRNDLRDILVPINKIFPLEMLIDACSKYPGAKQSRLVTWEYVMLAGVNDTMQDVNEMVNLLHTIPSLINLIPFNPWPGSNFQCSSYEAIQKFKHALLTHPKNHGQLKVSVRTPRGRDILAACGQLAVLKNAKDIPDFMKSTSSTEEITSTTASIRPPSVQNLPKQQEQALEMLLNKQ